MSMSVTPSATSLPPASRDALLGQLQRSLLARILAAVLWLFPVTLTCVVIVAEAIGLVVHVGREQASWGAGVVMLLTSPVGIVLAVVLSFVGFLPGTAKFKTAHRCPECLAPAAFDRGNVKSRSALGSWPCAQCGTELQVNRIHLLAGVLIAVVVVIVVNQLLRVGSWGSLIWLLVSGVMYRIAPILTSVTRRPQLKASS
jgi:uncharacterized protein (DUF983 family)